VCNIRRRAAEQVIFNNISTGALSDLETVTKRAQAMVTIYGLSPNIGNILTMTAQDSLNILSENLILKKQLRKLMQRSNRSSKINMKER
jgi:ATP-dependent Zn protease